MKTEVLVVGGGPAGCTAAIQLARAGRQVLLVEREREPAHKVCGEFLSGEALIYLQQLGIDLASLGAIPIRSVRFTSRKSSVERPLPFAAMSLTRRALDAELLHLATNAGVRIHRGCSVDHLTRADGGWVATLAGGEEVNAATVFLASGKHDVRGHLRPQGKQRGLVAFKMYWRLNDRETEALADAVEILTYPGGYAGLQPVEEGVANLCCLIHADELRRIGGGWQNLLAHVCSGSTLLRQRLEQAKPQLAKPLTISALPYGYVRANSDGIWYLGDQAAVIPSFTGDGMSLALHSGLLAAQLFLQNHAARSFQQQFAAQVRCQVAIATAVSRAIVRAPQTSSLVTKLWPGALGLVARATRIHAASVATSGAPQLAPQIAP